MRTDTTANSGQPFYYQQNHEGSVTHLTDASGTVIEKYRYDVFGAPTAYDGNGNVLTGTAYNNRFLFTGREYRWAYGFYEYRARAYHPTVGRFMSEDPKLFDAGDYNLFRYCHNDPEDLTDPLGLENVPGQFWAPTPERMAASSDYNDQMAAAHWNMTGSNNSASAIGIGAAGYQAWSAAGGLIMAQTQARSSVRPPN